MKQHFIPKCYLRRFTPQRKCMFAYDKIASSQRVPSIDSVCQEVNLYAISEQFRKENKEKMNYDLNVNFLEKEIFAHDIESSYNKALGVLDSMKDDFLAGIAFERLSYEEKRDLAGFIIIQYLRMPHIRDYVVDDRIRMEHANLDMIQHIMAETTGDENFRNIKIDVEVDKAVLHAQTTYLNPEFLFPLMDIMANNFWIFKVSKNNDFYTSDFPVVVEPHVKEAKPIYLGLAQYGGEITFPITPGLAVSIYDKEYFPDKKDLDSSFLEVDDKEIRRLNLMRYFYAKRYVFSLKNDFELVKSFLSFNDNTHIFYAPNHKSTIVSGLGKY